MMDHRPRVPPWRTLFAGSGVRALLALILCAVLAGCGSSGNSGASPATTSPTTSTGPSTTAQTGTSTGTGTTTTTQGDPSGKLDKLPPASQEPKPPPSAPGSATTESERSYLTAVFNDAQGFWKKEFRDAGVQYHPARLQLFKNEVQSGCGAQSDTGPFYCPANRTVYLDLSFFEALARHAGIGRFGQAYIVGHELGHHIQNLLGISQQLHALDQQDPSGSNARSVRTELQADCLAGVWAHSNQARGDLTEADLNDALKTAAFVGDDFQQQAAGHVVDSSMWTHGSAAQRQHWLKAGFQSGRSSDCDTFTNTSP